MESDVLGWDPFKKRSPKNHVSNVVILGADEEPNAIRGGSAFGPLGGEPKVYDFIGASDHLMVTPPKFNIAPENGWLEYYFPIGKVTFQGLC